MRAASVKFNIPDTSIIVKWKKDFATFVLVGLQPKTRGRPTFMDTNKRKKRKSDKLARSNFYYHQKKTKSADKYQVIKELIKSIYHKHKGRYGYRRITDELNYKGMVINHKTVLRLMKLLGLKSLIRVKKYKSYKGEQGKIAPNILERKFKATAPNQKRATDINEFNVSLGINYI